MRYFTSAVCTTIAAVLLASCSNSAGSPSSALPNPGTQMPGASHHTGQWIPFNSAGWKSELGVRDREARPPQGTQRGLAATKSA